MAGLVYDIIAHALLADIGTLVALAIEGFKVIALPNLLLLA